MIIELDGITRDASGNPEAEYQWAKSDTMTGTYNEITGAVGMTYLYPDGKTTRTATSRWK